MHDFVIYFLWPMLANLIALSAIGAFGWRTFRKQHLHTLRMALFTDLMGNRYDTKGPEFTAALNRAFVLFHDDPTVIRCARDLAAKAKTQTSNLDALTAVFRAICRNLGIPDVAITDDDFQTAFNLRTQGPVQVNLGINHTADGPQPQILVAGYAAPNAVLSSVTALDIPSAQRLMRGGTLFKLSGQFKDPVQPSAP